MIAHRTQTNANDFGYRMKTGGSKKMCSNFYSSMHCPLRCRCANFKCLNEKKLSLKTSIIKAKLAVYLKCFIFEILAVFNAQPNVAMIELWCGRLRLMKVGGSNELWRW